MCQKTTHIICTRYLICTPRLYISGTNATLSYDEEIPITLNFNNKILCMLIIFNIKS